MDTFALHTPFATSEISTWLATRAHNLVPKRDSGLEGSSIIQHLDFFMMQAPE